MADELDPRLEARLRAALHAEADALPLLVREQDILRARDRRRVRRLALPASLVGAAAVVALLVTAGSMWRGDPNGVAGSPSPSASERPLATYGELLSLLGTDATVLLQGEHPVAGTTGDLTTVELGTVGPVDGLAFAIHCLGGGVDILITGADTGTFHTDCGILPIAGMQLPALTGPATVTVVAPDRVRWRIVITEGVGLVFPRPTSEATPQPPVTDFGVTGEAIVVYPVGDDPARPDEIVVDAWTPTLAGSAPAGTARLGVTQRTLARIPGTMIEPELRLVLPVEAKLSRTGLLALSVESPDGEEMLIIDLTGAKVNNHVLGSGGVGNIAFAPDGRLALIGSDGSVNIKAPDGNWSTWAPQGQEAVTVRGTPIWLADGSGVLGARYDDAGAPVFGVVGPTGWTELGTDLPALAQVTGLERPFDPSGHRLGLGCDSSGPGGGACVLVRTRGDEPPERWGDLGTAMAGTQPVWALDGQRAWLLTGGGASGWDLVLALRGTVEASTLLLQPGTPGASLPRLIGIRDVDPADAIAIFDDPAGTTWTTAMGGGVGFGLPRVGVFAGWAGDAGVYPAP